MTNACIWSAHTKYDKYPPLPPPPSDNWFGQIERLPVAPKGKIRSLYDTLTVVPFILI